MDPSGTKFSPAFTEIQAVRNILCYPGTCNLDFPLEFREVEALTLVMQAFRGKLEIEISIKRDGEKKMEQRRAYCRLPQAQVACQSAISGGKTPRVGNFLPGKSGVTAEITFMATRCCDASPSAAACVAFQRAEYGFPF